MGKDATQGRTELLIGSLCMPHRNMEDVKELEKSLNPVSTKKNIRLTGNSNCPDINCDTMTINQDAQDKEIQRAVMEVVTSYSMVQIHEQPSRGNNLLDIVLTTNSSLIKSSNNPQGYLTMIWYSQIVTQNLTTSVHATQMLHLLESKLGQTP
jgi:hypothetical protein